MQNIPISLQMFSLRALWETNPLEAMKTVKNAGYQGVEFYGQHYKADLYAALLKECGVVCSGWHVMYADLDNDFDLMAERNKAVGNDLMVVPVFNADTAKEWYQFAEKLNTYAEKCAPLGMQIGYHNHAHEFRLVDGERPWDIIVRETVPEVCLQMDVGHVMNGGCDPVAELAKFSGRTRSIHFKPFSHELKFEVPIGEDDVDWQGCLAYCREKGNTRWLVIEYTPQEDPAGAVTKSAAALRKICGC
ncbi:MAG: sugar phosphate isomerase/epimerase [Lentisphaeria bacterium]|nr:sugar phosphate isomerase/epimerase [Lentisphaeria bacterium]